MGRWSTHKAIYGISWIFCYWVFCFCEILELFLFQVAKQVQVALATRNFRVYTATDVIGAELCGALKNVLAIACGASDGFGFGANARAALITRGREGSN